MTISVKAALLPEEDPELRRWLVASAVVAAMHAGILWWLMHKMDLNLSGAPPAAVMIELPPMDVSPPAETSPDVAEGPEMRQAEPEEVETPQVITPQEIPPAKKPDAVLVTKQKPKPKPKKIVKEKPVVKRTHEPPAPRTTAPRRAQPARGQTSAAPRQGLVRSGASTSSWRSQIYARLLGYKPGGGEATGVVSVSFTLTHSEHPIASGLAGSSGSAALDQKALAMVRHANPYPAAPSDVVGGSIHFTVPVRFR
jgi:periplasmic protein TonB